jgi:protein SCO1/2
MLFRILFLFLSSVFFLACGGGDGNITLEDNGQPTFYKRHPPDPDNPGMHLVDSLGYPGNQPTDPVTGKIMPEPVREWEYVDQLNRPFGSEDLKGKVYVAEFFFTSCPTICPRVKGQMLRLEEKFADSPDFRLVSFTVDPKRDTPEKMKEYAEKLGTRDMDRWRYIYGDKIEIYDLDNDYLSIAEEDPNSPGGFNHSGYIVLVDREGFVRSYASGLDPEEVNYLMEDIDLLLK